MYLLGKVAGTVSSVSRKITNLSGLICQQSALSSFFPLSPGLKLSKVPMVIAFHLQVKHLGLSSRSRGNQVGLEKVQYAIAYLAELCLNSTPIFLNSFNKVLITTALLLLLNRRYDPPRSPPRTNHILVRHRKKVPFLHS
nr:Os04g0462550 [Ipomoea batatas]